MSVMYGMFVSIDPNKSTVTSKVKQYDTYQEMIADTNPEAYGIVDSVVYHNVNGEWIVGFPNVVKEETYTAFEVYPTNEVIPAGTVSDVKYAGPSYSASSTYNKGSVVYHPASDTVYKNIAECKGIEPSVTEGWDSYWTEHEGFDGAFFKYIKEVPAGATVDLRMFAYSKNRSECNIVVDWGDGNVSTVADPKDTSVVSFSDYQESLGPDYRYSNVNITHTYADEDCGKKHIVKIFGNDYFLLRTNNAKTNNIVSRVFDRDLPVAPCLTNISNGFSKSLKLLQVAVPYGYNPIANIRNLQSAFSTCENLRYCDFNSNVGIGTKLHDHQYVFFQCTNLECDINNLNELFSGGVTTTYNQEFVRCAKLFGTINPKVYWDNPNNNTYASSQTVDNNFTITAARVFRGCSEELCDQIPSNDWK